MQAQSPGRELLDGFDYDAMYEANVGAQEQARNSKQSAVVKHVLKEIIAKRTLDMTKIPLPAYIMEQRSVVETFADLIRPRLLVDIPEGRTGLDRMVRVLKFYLGGFSKMRGDTDLAKKPYNPVQGEFYRCVWDPSIAKARRRGHPHLLMRYAPPGGWDDAPSSVGTAATPKRYERGQRVEPPNVPMLKADPGHVNFIGEQVSHHPPVTALYAVCPLARVSLSGSIEVKAEADYKFSIFQPLKGVRAEHIGKLVIHDARHNEKYAMSFPTAYASSLLTVPKLDFVGRSKIVGSNGYRATIQFLEDERFGVRATIAKGRKSKPTGVVVTGRWNSSMSIATTPGGRAKPFLTVGHLPVETKLCQPVARQHWLESQRLWRRVTRAMVEGRSDAAMEEKKRIEERHRTIAVSPTHFRPSQEGTGSRWKLINR